ncbi:hypothetical protein IWX50DRAFT_144787 [Phyllosticta citricarpa]
MSQRLPTTASRQRALIHSTPRARHSFAVSALLCPSRLIVRHASPSSVGGRLAFWYRCLMLCPPLWSSCQTKCPITPDGLRTHTLERAAVRPSVCSRGSLVVSATKSLPLRTPKPSNCVRLISSDWGRLSFLIHARSLFLCALLRSSPGVSLPLLLLAPRLCN